MDDNHGDSSENQPQSQPSAFEQASLSDYGGDGVDYSPHFQTREVFPTYQAAVDWAREIATPLGFFLTNSSYKKQRNGLPINYMKCDRGERNRGENRDRENATRKNTNSKGCKCTFQISARCLRDMEGWIIKSKKGLKGMHNHPLMVYREGHRQVSGLSPAAKTLVIDMSSAAAKPRHIMAAVKEKFPNESPNKRHIYNVRSRARLDACEGRDVAHQFVHLANEYKYVTWINVDPDTCAITHAFLAHPEMANMLRTYPHVIGMDSTYKTNRYNMPFFELVGVTPTNQNFLIGYAILKSETYESYKWVLEKLQLYIGFEVAPNVFVTDCDWEGRTFCVGRIC
ncbi:protein FAR1-RELATED SEQUENCE 5-like [Chenopodium quinoa]|uniref:protein FAR1-RELATED SEQUENCE 5-like n=1 Tax=Chenopodium quinoa TaxID=63459 RepID=UPI000B772734|nr:protein FAR1-RELATED SEQUENCE 5-like [Chenopodium quinoa]